MPKLPKVDLSKLSTSDIDKMSHAALRDAVRSVIRNPNVNAMHKDHRSHSSVDARVSRESRKPMVKPGLKGGGGLKSGGGGG